MDEQPTNLMQRAERIGARIVAEAEKLGHEALHEIETLLHLKSAARAASQPTMAPTDPKPEQPA